jgi:hypothetical protein
MSPGLARRFSLCTGIGNRFLVLRQYGLLDHVSRFSVDRISKLPMGAVSLLLARKRDEKSPGAVHDSDLPDHKTVVEDNAHVGSD